MKTDLYECPICERPISVRNDTPFCRNPQCCFNLWGAKLIKEEVTTNGTDSRKTADHTRRD